MTTTYVRVYADERGESHFDEVEVELIPRDFAPPAPPLRVAALFPAAGSRIVGDEDVLIVAVALAD